MDRRMLGPARRASLPTVLVTILLAAFGSARAAGPLPAGSLSGTVVGPDGKPVAGASVFIDDFDYDAGDYRPVSKTTTGEDGLFRLGPLDPVYRSGQDLRVVAQGFAPYTASEGAITVFPATDSDLGRIRLDRGQVITGQVLDTDGSPRAGAAVECQARRYVSFFGSPLTPTYKITTGAGAVYDAAVAGVVRRADGAGRGAEVAVDPRAGGAGGRGSDRPDSPECVYTDRRHDMR